jgi:DNA invertase Pin-like site-specific DNA recombinase
MMKTEIADNTGIVTFAEMQRKLGVSAMTLKRKINSGELPPLDFGSNNGRAKFWMRNTLEEFYKEKRLAAQAVGSAD